MHHSRLCAILIDCKTDDIDAAAGQLERWVVMQVPTGQRFCVVRVQRPGYPKNANTWA